MQRWHILYCIMPFTLSHPAAVLPFAYLLRKYVCLTGLAAGAMAPDFEYFFMMQPKSEISHTIAGIFLFCLPVGLLLSFIYHNIIRDSLIDSLPLFLKARFGKATSYCWNRLFVKRWFITAPSIIFGAWTHIFWDSFTHYQFEMYQHPSTAAGAIIIIIAILKLPKDDSITGKTDVKYWAFFAFITALILAICFLCGLRVHIKYIGRVVVSITSACLIAITLTSIIWKCRKGKTAACRRT